MKARKARVSVGICAYNEEKNIRQLIKQVFAQKGELWELLEIVVNTDNCSDRTVPYLKAFGDKRIVLLEQKERRGKPYGVQQILKKFRGDYLVVLDADVMLGDNRVIERMVKAFVSDSQVMLVGANTRPFEPKTFFERAVYATFRVYEKSRSLNGGNTVFGFTGGGMAIAGKFAREVEFPGDILNEDDFFFFTARQKGYGFRHVQEAEIYYKLPQKLSDYVRQIFRSDPGAAVINFEDRFGQMVHDEYHRPFGFMVKSVWQSFLADPLPALYVIAVNMVCRPLYGIISPRYKLSWYTAESTK